MLRFLKSIHGRLPFFLLLFISAFSLPSSASEIGKSPLPSWVDLTPAPAPNPARTGLTMGGRYELEIDRFFRYRPGGVTITVRRSYLITERPGLEQGARIDFDYEPSNDTVSMHRIAVIRGGIEMDRLSAAKFDQFRRETDTDRGIFDGRMTVHFDIPDVMVGDVVEYAYSVDSQNKLENEPFSYGFFSRWDVPVGRIRTVFMWPTGQDLLVRAPLGTAPPKVEINGGMTFRSWIIDDPEPVKNENDAPQGADVIDIVQVGEAANWQRIASALEPYFRQDTGETPLLAALSADISERNSTAGAKFIAAVRYVQDNIRYVSLSIGNGSYIPRAPETVISSGFGDCKDKSLLLVSLLQRLGIEAHVALANLDKGYLVDQFLPALAAFDHAIVKADLAGKTIWIDATNSLQGGDAKSIAQPDYGFVLPLAAGQTGLEDMGRIEPAGPQTIVEEHFSMPDREDGPITLSVKSTYLAGDADRMRWRLKTKSLSDLSDLYLDYFGNYYPGITVAAPVSYVDERDGNRLVVSEKYEISKAALDKDDLIKDFPLHADFSLSDLPSPRVEGRRLPVDIGRAFVQRHVVRVSNLKEEYTARLHEDIFGTVLNLKTYFINGPSFIEFTFEYKKHKGIVSITEIQDFLDSKKKAMDNVTYYYDFTYSENNEKLSWFDLRLPIFIIFAFVIYLFSFFINIYTSSKKKY